MSTNNNRLLADYFNLAEASYADFSKIRIGTEYNEKNASKYRVRLGAPFSYAMVRHGIRKMPGGGSVVCVAGIVV